MRYSGYYRDDFRIQAIWYSLQLPAYSTQVSSIRSLVSASYEHFRDHRTADRGVPSFNGSALQLRMASTFFGNPSVSYANAVVDAGDL